MAVLLYGGWTHPYWHDEIGAHFGQAFMEADRHFTGKKDLAGATETRLSPILPKIHLVV